MQTEVIQAGAIQGKRGINSAVLKNIAVVTMLIDHIGAVIMTRLLIRNGLYEAMVNQEAYTAWMGQNGGMYGIYMAMRIIGRLAFPIYCFLLVEGFQKTHNVKKYLGRMFLFALISEVPFDLAFSGKAWYPAYQNVFFTLFLGLLLIWYLRDVSTSTEWSLAGALAVCCAAEVLHVDYGAFGVALIGIYYIVRELPVLQAGAGAILSAWEMPAPLGSLLLLFYNGERGRQPKWFFYWFYPVHLFLYYVIGTWVLPAWI